MTRITVQYGVELQFRDGLGWIGSGWVDFFNVLVAWVEYLESAVFMHR